MSKHTPGPWEQDEFFIYKKGVSRPIAETHLYTKFLERIPVPKEQMLANARLISCAPEMFELLTFARNEMLGLPAPTDLFSQINSLIKKINGDDE